MEYNPIHHSGGHDREVAETLSAVLRKYIPGATEQGHVGEFVLTYSWRDISDADADGVVAFNTSVNEAVGMTMTALQALMVDRPDAAEPPA